MKKILFLASALLLVYLPLFVSKRTTDTNAYSTTYQPNPPTQLEKYVWNKARMTLLEFSEPPASQITGDYLRVLYIAEQQEAVFRLEFHEPQGATLFYSRKGIGIERYSVEMGPADTTDLKKLLAQLPTTSNFLRESTNGAVLYIDGQLGHKKYSLFTGGSTRTSADEIFEWLQKRELLIVRSRLESSRRTLGPTIAR